MLAREPSLRSTELALSLAKVASLRLARFARDPSLRSPSVGAPVDEVSMAGFINIKVLIKIHPMTWATH